MNSKYKVTEDLCTFISSSPTQFHAVKNMENGIPCVKATQNEEYSSYLAVIPGKILAQLYLPCFTRAIGDVPCASAFPALLHTR